MFKKLSGFLCMLKNVLNIPVKAKSSNIIYIKIVF